MAKPTASDLDRLLTAFAQALANDIALVLPRALRRHAPRLVNFQCRYEGCSSRSKGPRFRYFCDEHRKLSKKEQDAALAKWAEKNA